MTHDSYRSLRLGALLLFGVALAGCGPGGAWMLTALALLVLTLVGCSESHEMGRDGSVPIDAPVVGSDAGGSWETCCESGRLSTCFCPAGAACNYGMGLIVCDDGHCGYGFDVASVCEPLDAGPADAGAAEDAGEPGTWEACCNEEGRIEMCFCPAGAICNYGLFDDCGDGLCTYPGGTCPAPE